MSNYEKIKKMTIDEMAKFLERINDAHGKSVNKIACTNCIYYDTLHMPKDCIREGCEYVDIGIDIKKWLESSLD